MEQEMQPGRIDLTASQAERNRNSGGFTASTARTTADKYLETAIQDFGEVDRGVVSANLANLLMQEGSPRAAIRKLYEMYGLPIPPGLDPDQDRLDDATFNQVISGG